MPFMVPWVLSGIPRPTKIPVIRRARVHIKAYKSTPKPQRGRQKLSQTDGIHSHMKLVKDTRPTLVAGTLLESGQRIPISVRRLT